MCYSAKSILSKKLRLAIRYGAAPEKIKDLIDQLQQVDPHHSFHYVSAFTHPKLMVKTSQSAEVELMEWGLIPHWCKTEAQAKQLSEMTFNARSESIFEKPAFRDAARSHRCLVAIDGYYEYLHLNQRKYPFFVQLKTGPMVLAGLWSEWVSPETGEIKRTHTLVTTEANALLKQVHNTKQRMPVVLSEEGQEQWMDPSISAEALFRPFPSNAFHVHSTPPILGYKGVGDSPEASSHFEYPELTFTYADLAEVSESRD